MYPDKKRCPSIPTALFSYSSIVKKYTIYGHGDGIFRVWLINIISYRSKKRKCPLFRTVYIRFSALYGGNQTLVKKEGILWVFRAVALIMLYNYYRMLYFLTMEKSAVGKSL